MIPLEMFTHIFINIQLESCRSLWNDICNVVHSAPTTHILLWPAQHSIMKPQMWKLTDDDIYFLFIYFFLSSIFSINVMRHRLLLWIFSITVLLPLNNLLSNGSLKLIAAAAQMDIRKYTTTYKFEYLFYTFCSFVTCIQYLALVSWRNVRAAGPPSPSASPSSQWTRLWTPNIPRTHHPNIAIVTAYNIIHHNFISHTL